MLSLVPSNSGRREKQFCLEIIHQTVLASWPCYNMMVSRTIHVAAAGIISFFLWLSNIPLYICTTSSICTMPIHLLKDILVVSVLVIVISAAMNIKVKLLSHGQIFVTPWTVAYHAPPSMGFSRQEYWSELPYPSPGDLPDPGIEPWSPAL